MSVARRWGAVTEGRKEIWKGRRKKERRGTKEGERKSERCVCRLRKKQTGKREGGRASAGLAKRHSVKLTAII